MTPEQEHEIDMYLKPVAPEYISTVPSYSYSVPKYIPTVSSYSYSFAVPEYISAVPSYSSAVPEYIPIFRCISAPPAYNV